MRHALATILAVIGTTACGGEFAAGIDRCVAQVVARDVVVCLGNQCFRLPVSPSTTGDQAAAAGADAADPSPAAAFTKPTLFYFTQANCAPCRRVEALQRDANVAKWLRNGYTFQRMDLRSTDGRALAMLYGVNATPTHVVVQGNRELARWNYVTSPADYARKLDAAWRAAGGKR